MSTKSTDLVIAKFDYKATDKHELGIQKGERLTVLDDTQKWWQVMNAQGATGYVPSNYVKRSKQGIFSSLRNTLGRRKSRQEGGTTSARSSKPSSPVPDNNGIDNPIIKHESVGSLGDKLNQLKTSSGALPPNYPGGDPQVHSKLDGFHPYSIPGSNNGIDSVQKTAVPHGYDRTHEIDGQLPSGWRFNNVQPPSIQHHTQIIPTSLGTAPAITMRQNGHGELANPIPVSQHLGHQHQMSAVDNQVYFGTGSGIGRHICQALFAYPASQQDELSIERGDKIRVLEKSSDGWWRGILVTEGRPSLMGWFPSNYVTLDLSKNLNRAGSTSQPNNLNSGSLGLTDAHVSHTITTTGMTMQAQFQAQLFAHQYHTSKPAPPTKPLPQPAQPEFKNPHESRETVLTLYPFARNQVEEMSFDANEILEVIDKPPDDPDWWRCSNARGDTGLVPRNYVRVLLNPAPNVTAPTVSASQPSPNVSRYEKQRHESEELRLMYASRSNTARLHIDQPWCWGSISRAQCESMLGQYARPGEFIIRDSESHPGDLTITINAGNKSRNFKVHVEHGQYHIGQKVFPSVQDLIDHYLTHPIFKNDQEKHYLTRPFVHPGKFDTKWAVSSSDATHPSSYF